MAKFCENCGTELKDGQDVCLGCGKVIKKEKKSNHAGYYISTSIIMMFLAFCLFCAFFYYDMESPLTFAIPALFGLSGAIVCISGKKNKVALIVSGGLYIAGAICNIIAIEDISLYTIISLVFAGINIGFGCKMKG